MDSPILFFEIVDFHCESNIFTDSKRNFFFYIIISLESLAHFDRPCYPCISLGISWVNAQPFSHQCLSLSIPQFQLLPYI